MPYLDPENVFPKRLGLMNGNTLVIEYYNLAKDKFKKHPIPFDPSADPQAVIEAIFKDQKHQPYLKKVDPKHLRAVLQGKAIPPPPQRAQPPPPPRHDYGQFAEDVPAQVQPQQPIYHPPVEERIIHEAVPIIPPKKETILPPAPEIKQPAKAPVAKK